MDWWQPQKAGQRKCKPVCSGWDRMDVEKDAWARSTSSWALLGGSSWQGMGTQLEKRMLLWSKKCTFGPLDGGQEQVEQRGHGIPIMDYSIPASPGCVWGRQEPAWGLGLPTPLLPEVQTGLTMAPRCLFLQCFSSESFSSPKFISWNKVVYNIFHSQAFNMVMLSSSIKTVGELYF